MTLTLAPTLTLTLTLALALTLTLTLTLTLARHPSPHPSPSPKQAQLRQVLVAYSLRNPRVGYVQGMGFIAALLLLFMEPEPAFWCLVAVVERLLPRDFFGGALLGPLVLRLGQG